LFVSPLVCLLVLVSTYTLLKIQTQGTKNVKVCPHTTPPGERPYGYVMSPETTKRS